MPEDASVSNAVAPRHAVAVVLAAGIVGLLLAASIGLWTYYGTAVFFETIRTGLVACFG
jgi:hypothetical protein